MFESEYRIGFRILTEEVGLLDALRIVIPALFRSLGTRYGVDENTEEPEKTKVGIKNRFKLWVFMYNELNRRYSSERVNEVVGSVMMAGGREFFKGFRPLGSEEDLSDFVVVYTDFERQNIVFDVIEETDKRFEIVIRRCLVYESFEELGAAELSQWMCDIAFDYFNSYHPKMRYEKDRMIARGDSTCHEVFTWQ
jgi:hypothetical protein